MTFGLETSERSRYTAQQVSHLIRRNSSTAICRHSCNEKERHHVSPVAFKRTVQPPYLCLCWHKPAIRFRQLSQLQGESFWDRCFERFREAIQIAIVKRDISHVSSSQRLCNSWGQQHLLGDVIISRKNIAVDAFPDIWTSGALKNLSRFASWSNGLGRCAAVCQLDTLLTCSVQTPNHLILPRLISNV